MRRSLLQITALAVLACGPAGAQGPAQKSPTPASTPGVVRAEPVARGLVRPWALAFLPNGDMLVTEQGKNTLRVVRGGVLDPTPVAGLPQGITSTRRDTAGVDIAIHPRFAENRYIYVAYWKPSPGWDASAKGTNIRTAVLIRARYDGSPTLSDVREIFASAS